MLNHKIVDFGNYPIKPSDINTENHFYNSFGKMEKETSAWWIVKLCQIKGNWQPFTYDEIEKLYNQYKYRNFWFNGLNGDGSYSTHYIIQEGDLYYITSEFVAKCFTSSPNLKSEAIK